MMKAIITEANIEMLDEFIILADEVGAWLWRKGVKQWAPGENRANRDTLASLVEKGCLILAYEDKQIIGGCILSTITPTEWPDASDMPDVLALNKLVVARSAAGKDVGRQIIQGCVQAAVRRGKSRIRLDCWEGNRFLKAYYQSEGFTMLGIIQCDGYKCRLFEKQIGQDTDPNGA